MQTDTLLEGLKSGTWSISANDLAKMSTFDFDVLVWWCTKDKVDEENTRG